MGSAAVADSQIALLAGDGFIFMIAFLGGTYLSWWALGIIRWEKFVLAPSSPQARMLRFLIAAVGGFILAMICGVYALAGQVIRLIF